MCPREPFLTLLRCAAELAVLDDYLVKIWFSVNASQCHTYFRW